ncbi:MAG: substrate-binding domain-containing protein [Actinomycetota bacterium]|nr:substrate-binding domain-containing protein [Actinomycetota bacterium]
MLKFLRLASLVAVLVLVAAACSDDDDAAEESSDAAQESEDTAGDESGDEDSDDDSAESDTGETVEIVASVPPTDHGWLGQIAAKAQEAADSHDDVEFRLLEAADADSQASQIQTVINEGPDALVVLPYDGDQLTPVAEEAMAAGIPVVNVDRLFATPEAARATILGDNYDIGVKAAQFISEQLACEGSVVEIQGIAGISVTNDRTAGFADTIDELCGDGIEIIAQQPADFAPDLGLEVMEAILQANDQIDAVYTHDDDMAEGVVAAIENAGREDEMILTGAGGSCGAFDRIAEGGLYAATYLYSPTMAGSAVNMARLIAQGRGMSDLVEPEVPSMIIVPPSQVTADNVDDLRDLCFE